MKAFLESKIDGIKVTMSATPTVSGAFEVTKTGSPDKKYWSKLGGQGYLDGDDAAMAKVADAIKADK